MKIIDTAFEGVFNRNKPMETWEVQVLDLSQKKDCYATYFIFGEKFRDHILKTNSVKGYDGVYTAEFLPFDIDCADNLKHAQEQAQALINRIQLVYGLCNADTQIFFTGAKGFHIQIPQAVFGDFKPSKTLSEDFRRIALEISSGIEIDTSIYDSVRLWRIPNTINGKTGLYKISISIEELFNLSIEQIKDLAKSPRPLMSIDP